MTGPARVSVLGRRATADGGFVAAEWVLAIALLVLPVLAATAVLPGWAARREAADAAAREATRVLAELGGTADAVVAAEQAAVELLVGRGVDPARSRTDLDRPAGDPPPRDGVVGARVTVEGEAVAVPGLGVLDPPAATGTHRRRLNPWRDRG